MKKAECLILSIAIIMLVLLAFGGSYSVNQDEVIDEQAEVIALLQEMSQLDEEIISLKEETIRSHEETIRLQKVMIEWDDVLLNAFMHDTWDRSCTYELVPGEILADGSIRSSVIQECKP